MNYTIYIKILPSEPQKGNWGGWIIRRYSAAKLKEFLQEA